MKKIAKKSMHGYPLKKSIQYLLLLMFFMLTHFCALAQQVRPKWLDNIAPSSAAGHAQVYDIAVDNQNNIYVTGTFQDSVNFDPKGIKYLYTINSDAVFAAKYKEDGTLIWVQSFAGDTVHNAAAAVPLSITVDKNANVSISGYFDAGNFNHLNIGPGVHSLYGILETGFLIHLDSAGNFLWAHNTGDRSYEGCIQTATDSQGNVIATGSFRTADTIGNAIYTISTTYCHGIIIKYDPAGNALWSINIGNNSRGDVLAFGCNVDTQDNVIVAGTFNNTVDFNPLGAAYNVTATSTNETFIAKYSPSGVLIWLSAINAGVAEIGLTHPLVSTDQLNNIYFAVSYTQSITFSNSLKISTKGYQDVCFAKYSPDGSLQYAKTIGGSSINNSAVYGVCYKVINDKSNNIYLTGGISGTVNFDLNGGTQNITCIVPDLFLAKYDTNSNYINAFTIAGIGPTCDFTLGYGMAVDGDNNLDYVGQFCASANFDPSGCINTVTSASSLLDGFIIQYGPVAISNDSIAAPVVNSFCSAGATPGAITGSLPTGASGVYTYQWLSSADSVNFADITAATGQNYTPPILNATTYFQRIVASGTCTPSITSNIVALKITNIQPLVAPVVKVAGATSSSVIFTWSAVPDATGYQVSTDGGQTYTAHAGLTDTISGLQGGQSVTITVQATGTSVCQLSATSAAVTGQTIDVIYVANAFTPNGDGRNDVVHVLGANIQTLKFYVYDQWGEQIFSSTNQQNGWDGTYKGTKEPVGVYVYYLEAVMNDGQIIKKKGSITLLK